MGWAGDAIGRRPGSGNGWQRCATEDAVRAADGAFAMASRLPSSHSCCGSCSSPRPLTQPRRRPKKNPFYAYHGVVALADIAPGTVLKTRTLAYHVAGVPLPVKAVQLLYRSSGETGQPTVNVTSVLEPPRAGAAPNIVAYQSFYDSLNPDDEPSYAISGGLTLGGIIPNIESLLIAPELLAGDAVVVADTEGESANFAAGPRIRAEHVDSLRAALKSPATRPRRLPKIGLIGYSGGAIATEWAAELAPSYAPDARPAPRRRVLRRRARRAGAQPALRQRQRALGRRDPDGPDRDLACIRYRPARRT